MVSKRFQFVSLIAMVLSISAFPHLTQAETIHDFASWNGVMLQGNSTGNFGYYFEFQNRLNQTLNTVLSGSWMRIGNLLSADGMKYFTL
ncbi:MAG: hypothetical protein ABIQ95_03465 [Bdellovibrionia bacterium]